MNIHCILDNLGEYQIKIKKGRFPKNDYCAHTM